MAVFAFVAIAGLWLNVERDRTRDLQEAARLDAQDALDLLASRLQAALDRDTQILNGLVALATYDPDLDNAKFARMSERLLEGRNDIIHLTGAPGAVARFVYPVEGNEWILGRPLAGRAKVELSTNGDAGLPVVQGPFVRRNGVRAFAIRAPVLLSDGKPWELSPRLSRSARF